MPWLRRWANDVLVRFSADTAGLNAGVAAAASQIRGFGQQVAAVGAVAGIAMVGIGAAAAHMAGDFQFSINKLYTTAGEAKTSLGAVSSGILQMSVDVGTGAQKMADAMYYVESAGFHGQQGLDVLRVAAEGAKTENADLNDVVRALTASMNAYGPALATPAETMNTLIAATAHGSMQLQDLTTGLKNVLPAAAHFGISLEDTAAAMAVMTTQGDNAASAGTHLRQVILSLEAPAKPAREALAAIGLTTAQIASEMRVSLPGALQLITDKLKEVYGEGTPKYNQALKDISGGNRQMMGMLETTGQHMNTFQLDVAQMSAQIRAGGKDIMGWAEVQKTFNFQLDRGRAALEAFMINLGGKLLPVLTPIVQGFADAIPKVQAFFDELGKPIATAGLGQWATSLHEIIDNLGQMKDSVGVLIGQSHAWDNIGTSAQNAATAILGAGAALTGFEKQSGDVNLISGAFKLLGDDVKNSLGAFQDMGDQMGLVFNLITGHILTTGQALQYLGKDSTDVLTVADATELLSRNITHVTDSVTGADVNLKDFVHTGNLATSTTIDMATALHLVGKGASDILTADDATKLLKMGIGEVKDATTGLVESLSDMSHKTGAFMDYNTRVTEAWYKALQAGQNISFDQFKANFDKGVSASILGGTKNADTMRNKLRDINDTPYHVNMDTKTLDLAGQKASDTKTKLQQMNDPVKTNVDSTSTIAAGKNADLALIALGKLNAFFNPTVNSDSTIAAGQNANNTLIDLQNLNNFFNPQVNSDSIIAAGTNADSTRNKLIAANGPYYPDVDSSSILAAGYNAMNTQGDLLALNGSSVWNAYVNTYETTYVATIGGPGSGPGNARAGGGLITEPVVGVGLRTGERWTFGENGNEMVVPLTGSKASGGGQAGVSGGKHDARIAAALERLNDLLSNPQRVSEYQVAQAVGKLLVNGVR